MPLDHVVAVKTCAAFTALPHFDGSANQIAPFGSPSVKIFHVLSPQRVFQDKPAVAGTLADTATSDDQRIEIDVCVGVEFSEIIGGFVHTLVERMLRQLIKADPQPLLPLAIACSSARYRVTAVCRQWRG
jgi:hypothetical protein